MGVERAACLSRDKNCERLNMRFGVEAKGQQLVPPEDVEIVEFAGLRKAGQGERAKNFAVRARKRRGVIDDNNLYEVRTVQQFFHVGSVLLGRLEEIKEERSRISETRKKINF